MGKSYDAKIEEEISGEADQVNEYTDYWANAEAIADVLGCSLQNFSVIPMIPDDLEEA